MRRIFRLSVICAVVGVVSACSRDEVITTPDIPTAGVRFINAVTDTAGGFGLDFRFVDIVESNAQFRVSFRNTPVVTSGVTASTQIEFKNAKAGARHFRVFLDDTLQTVATVILKDSTINIEAGKNYTVLLWGNARSGVAPALQLKVFEETAPDPGAQVGLRVLNTTGNPIDVRQYAQGGTAPATATWASVAAGAASAYVNVAPGQIMYNVRAAGGATSLFADALALPGAAPSSSAGPGGKIDIEALPGTTVAGSAVTLIVFPRSVAGTRTPQTTTPIDYTNPGGSFMWDRRPPRPAGI